MELSWPEVDLDGAGAGLMDLVSFGRALLFWEEFVGDFCRPDCE